MSNDYYVYLYLREDGTPYYVGKGKGDRAFQRRRRKIKRPDDESKIIFHAENLTEDEAFALEKELIVKYGRKDNGTGILRNLTDGGEGSSGWIPTEENKKNISVAMKKSHNTPEVKARISEAVKKHHSDPKIKAKISSATKQAMNRPEVKAKLRKAMKASVEKTHRNSPQFKAKMSEVMKSYYAKNPKNSPQFKAKMSEVMKAYYAKNPKPKKKLEQSTSTANLAPFFVST